MMKKTAEFRSALVMWLNRSYHQTQIEADVCPEIEWPAHQKPPSDDEDDECLKPHSPLVHPAVVAADFANDG